MTPSRRLGAFLALVVVLASVAVVSSRLRLPDTFFYTRAAERMITPGCSQIHCFRVLVPWIIGAIPGPSLVKWKGYGVLCNAAAAIAVFDLCLVFGLTRRASTIAAALTGFGFGSFYTLWEPYTSDPLMFWLSPLVLRWALQDRIAAAGAAALVGVWAKEIVVVSLAIAAIAGAWSRRWATAWRAVGAGALAFAMWLALQAWLRLQFGYNYGDNTSPNLLSGAGTGPWLLAMSARGALSAMFNEFGVVWVLFPLGWRTAPPKLRQIALIALPFACLFAYVQQPDRALWNFHYLTSALAALVLEPMPDAFLALFFAVYGFANLKVGAQVSFVPHARYAYAVGLVLAAIAAAVYLKRDRVA